MATQLDPVRGFEVHRRSLPHIEKAGSQYFTTSTTYKRCPLTEHERDIVMESILFSDQKLYDLHAAVVMPDHMHLIIEPVLLEKDVALALSKIFHRLLGFTSRQMKRGKVWQGESYDHVIRNEKDYLEKLRYIIDNPVEAELVVRPEDYRWLWYKGM